MKSCHVLVVDDDPATRKLLTDVLSVYGYEVELATDGWGGVLALERTRPSMVLLDLRMPLLDGWGFVAHIRERGFDLPILLMTASSNAERAARELGVAGYFEKPLNFPALVATIEAYCS